MFCLVVHKYCWVQKQETESIHIALPLKHSNTKIHGCNALFTCTANCAAVAGLFHAALHVKCSTGKGNALHEPMVFRCMHQRRTFLAKGECARRGAEHNKIGIKSTSLTSTNRGTRAHPAKQGWTS